MLPQKWESPKKTYPLVMALNIVKLNVCLGLLRIVFSFDPHCRTIVDVPGLDQLRWVGTQMDWGGEMSKRLVVETGDWRSGDSDRWQTWVRWSKQATDVNKIIKMGDEREGSGRRERNNGKEKRRGGREERKINWSDETWENSESDYSGN